jgi:hypothetical protein
MLSSGLNQVRFFPLNDFSFGDIINIKRCHSLRDDIAMPEEIKSLIVQLSKLKFSFSATDAQTKSAIISAVRRSEPKSGFRVLNAAFVEMYHETLCFMQAYPDNAAILRLVDDELLRFGQFVTAFRQYSGKKNALDESGVAQTAIHHPYSLDMARWLLARFGDSVDIDWADYDEKEIDPLSGLLPIFALYMENDGIDDADLATSDWIKMATGAGNSLRWLIEQLEGLNIPVEVERYIYDNAELTLKWELGDTKGSRTLAKNHPRGIYYQRTPLKKRRIDLNKSIRRPPPPLRIISESNGERAIEILIRALLPRHRELWPATYANPREVYITGMGRCLDIYFFGMLPDYRMPLESNYAALIVKNGVPIGYGISVMFFDRCEIAINIFDSFRSGEASQIFEHFARVFYHHFGGRDFLMRQWQVGHENEEGIKSGSYWFYYKLGFRSLDKRVNSLAQEEWKNIVSDKTYRTSERTLKRLALSDMHIAPGRESARPYTELKVTELAFKVTRLIAEKFAGNRQKALDYSISKVKAAGINPSELSAGEREQFERFCPLLALTDDLQSWSRKEKADLLKIIKSKAKPREMEYVRGLQKHGRLKAAFERIAIP